MTSTRRLGKVQPIGITWSLAALLAVLVPPFDPPRAAVTERVVTDRHTGLAMDGYDPVAYFTDSRPKMGRPEFEYQFKGVIWRFSNAGNRDAFAENSDVYVPRFGGYDPIAIARGVAVPGNPTLWVVAQERLYLFYSNDARESFNADVTRAVAAAYAAWPGVSQGLGP
jgi:hypothetical protein